MKKPIIKKKYLNLFDALIIGGIIIGLIFLAFFLLRRSKNINVVIKITEKNILYPYSTPPNWFSEYFKEGMIAKDGLGKKTAEINQIYRYDLGPNSKALYLTLDLKADYSKGSGKFSYEGQSLIIGAPIKIEFQNILVEGLVTNIEGVAQNGKFKDMMVETQIMWYSQIFPETNGAPDFIAQAINVGDNAKDSLGNVLITIIDKRTEPAKKITTDASGNVFIRPDPLKKDVYLTLKLKVKEVENSINKEYYLFDDVRIKVGEGIPLHLRDISIYPTVTKILEVK